ncbi:hypothetical protein JOF55_004884 [Haloactinomyces albus]|uniref:Uncharacterized protein n=1 Tax=Haloactinomyces albus TaxID=1352928 RepID=A0AAE3ZJ55_9ACTN|nr:hypothetical protein [Haloactinomyces albus]
MTTGAAAKSTIGYGDWADHGGNEAHQFCGAQAAAAARTAGETRRDHRREPPALAGRRG